MRRLMAFFTGNWGLKILALILAIVVYYSMKETSGRVSRNENSPVFLKGPADGGK